MSTTALQTRERSTLPAASEWSTMLSMAEVLVKSGMLPQHIKTPQAAVAIIQKGRELGIQPMYALSNIAVIQGKPTANAELMLALIYRDHGDQAIIFPATDATRCVIAYKRRGWPQAQTYAFTLDEAKAAGLLSNQTWQKYPAAMLRARCISAVARMAFPDSIGGFYTPEELGAEVDEDGTPIHATAEPTPLREVRPPSTPLTPERAAPLSAPRIKATVQPEPPPPAEEIAWSTPEQHKAIAEMVRERGIAPDAVLAIMRERFPDATDNEGKPRVAQLTADEAGALIIEIDATYPALDAGDEAGGDEA